MSMIDDLKERALGAFSTIKDKVQESSIYHQAMDRFENLSPVQQRLSLIGLALFSFFIVLYLPLSNLSSSTDSIFEFETKRDLIQDLLLVTKEASQAPTVPRPPSVEALRNQVQSQVSSSGLLPEQIGGIDTLIDFDQKIIPKSLSQGGIRVQLKKLNLRQVTNFGGLFQSISPSVKMINLKIEANREDPRYFDFMVSLLALKVPDPMPVPLPVNEKGPSPSRGGFRGGNKAPTDKKLPGLPGDIE